MLQEDLLKNEKVIVSGVLCGWGDRIKHNFDLVIFLWIPQNIRLARLERREIDRYGDEICVGVSRYKESTAFLEWASLYDRAGNEVRSKYLHEQWMSELNCPILRLEGDYPVQNQVDRILEYLDKNNSHPYK